jgi:phospholipid-translocating ATPase
LEELANLQAKTQSGCCLIIDGESLQLYMDNYQYEFIELAVKLPVVVACRCSPTQKVLIV